MREIFNWIFQNWRLVLEGVLLIASVVILIIKKKPINSIITAIYCASVEAIKVAELSDYKGKDKLNYCVGIVNASLKHSFPDLEVGTYYHLIVKTIEEILSTPQKKGD